MSFSGPYFLICSDPCALCLLPKELASTLLKERSNSYSFEGVPTAGQI